MQVLNFFSTVFADQMKRGRKTATIRLGDKRHKYRKNQVVLVTVGYQYSPREKLFHAVIDNVDVKRVKDLSPARHRARAPRYGGTRGLSVLDVARREVLHPLDLDVVDHRVEQLLARRVLIAPP